MGVRVDTKSICEAIDFLIKTFGRDIIIDSQKCKGIFGDVLLINGKKKEFQLLCLVMDSKVLNDINAQHQSDTSNILLLNKKMKSKLTKEFFMAEEYADLITDCFFKTLYPRSIGRIKVDLKSDTNMKIEKEHEEYIKDEKHANIEVYDVFSKSNLKKKTDLLKLRQDYLERNL